MRMYSQSAITEQSSTFFPFQNMLPRTTKQSFQSKLFSKKFVRSTSRLKTDKDIHCENMRLLDKIFEIKHRKTAQKFSFGKMSPKKKQNPQRSRQIILENKRLGKSLIKIKSGKSLEKVKTQITKINLKFGHGHKKLLKIESSNQRMRTQPMNLFLQKDNFNQKVQYKEQLSNLNMSKSLKRSRNLTLSQILELKHGIA